MQCFGDKKERFLWLCAFPYSDLPEVQIREQCLWCSAWARFFTSAQNPAGMRGKFSAHFSPGVIRVFYMCSVGALAEACYNAACFFPFLLVTTLHTQQPPYNAFSAL